MSVKGQSTATPAVPSTPQAPGDVPEAKAKNPKLQTECQPSPRASFLLSNPHPVLKTEQFLSTLVYSNSPGFQLSLFTSASCGRYEAELKSEIGKSVWCFKRLKIMVHIKKKSLEQSELLARYFPVIEPVVFKSM